MALSPVLATRISRTRSHVCAHVELALELRAAPCLWLPQHCPHPGASVSSSVSPTADFATRPPVSLSVRSRAGLRDVTSLLLP